MTKFHCCNAKSQLWIRWRWIFPTYRTKPKTFVLLPTINLRDFKTGTLLDSVGVKNRHATVKVQRRQLFKVIFPTLSRITQAFIFILHASTMPELPQCLSKECSLILFDRTLTGAGVVSMSSVYYTFHYYVMWLWVLLLCNLFVLICLIFGRNLYMLCSVV